MANTYDFNITQGCGFLVYLTAQNSDGSYINLSGYTGIGYVKNFYGDSNTIFNLNPTLTNPLESGVIAISGDYFKTANLPVGSFEYDIRIMNGISSIKVLNGDFNVLPSTSVYEPTGGLISL